MSKSLLIVVDGNALVHRAWHALPPLTSPAGEVVSGAYGFFSIILKAWRELQPSHVAVTFDLKGPTFRHEQYADYKGTREKQPDELYAQIPIIRRLLADAGVPVYDATGFEADDVIGTITAQATKHDAKVKCVILTGDMDTLQLVDGRVSVMTMRKGINDIVEYTPAAVRERYGLDPVQMIDYKALRGDASDNIPGVRGIGEKTATELLQKFETLEKLYAALHDGTDGLRETVRAKLLAGENDALQAQDLCRIRRDAPVAFDLDRSAFAMPTREKMEKSFAELGFMSLLKQLPTAQVDLFAKATADEDSGRDEDAEETAAPLTFTETIAADAASLADALKNFSGSARLALRSLSDDADGALHHRPTIRAAALTDGARVVVATGEALTTGLPDMVALWLSRNPITHDLKRELHALHAAGVVKPDGAAAEPKAFDTMLAAYLLAPGERVSDLNHLMTRRFGIAAPAKGADEAAVVARLALEAGHLPALAAALESELDEHQLRGVLDRIDAPVVPILAAMEERGVTLDTERLKELSKEINADLKTVKARIFEAADGEFNVNSPAQLKEVLFDKLKLEAAGLHKTSKSGTISTAASELEKLRTAHPIVGDILAYRELAKLKSTYVDALPELVDAQDGRLHAHFNQAVTATGRLSSSDPNLQNIPTPSTDWGRRLRDAFRAAPGCTLVAADYSQIELRLAAHMANEPVMIEAFRAGEDIHHRTAVAMFGEADAKKMRRVAKAINFGILYGMGPQLLSESAGISFSEAREYIKRWYEIHPAIRAYMDSLRAKAAEEGAVSTLFGRQRFFRNYHLLDRRERAEAERQAINMPLQGTSADMIKDAMARLDAIVAARYAGQAHLLLQVHDELVYEVKDGAAEAFAAELKATMESAVELSVPIVVDLAVGKRWGSMKE